MCGGEGDHFVSFDMPIEELCQYFRNNMHTMFMFKANSQYKQLLDARERYLLIMPELKARLREVPLKFLVALSNETEAFVGIMDPDNIPNTNETISDAAKKEIHRRTVKGLTVPIKNAKVDPTYLGFLRQPKF